MSRDPFYLDRGGGRYVATISTRGPWSPVHQHGGPVLALLGQCIEAAAGDECTVARIVAELLRPVPIAELDASVSVERDGRTARTFTAALHADGKLVARARGLALSHAALEVARGEATPFPAPEDCSALVLPIFLEPVGYHTAMELRVAAGEYGSGHLAAWMRSRVALIDERPLSALGRVLVAADSGNGLSARLDAREFTYPNPEVAVFLQRYPRQEWVLVDARTSLEPTGVGLAEARYWDADGVLGVGAQPLVVRAR